MTISEHITDIFHKSVIDISRSYHPSILQETIKWCEKNVLRYLPLNIRVAVDGEAFFPAVRTDYPDASEKSYVAARVT